MSLLKEKFLQVYSFMTLRDVNFTSQKSDDIPFYDEAASKWKNGDTSNVVLMSPKILNREIFVPANRVAFMGSFRSNGFRVRVEGRLRVL